MLKAFAAQEGRRCRFVPGALAVALPPASDCGDHPPKPSVPRRLALGASPHSPRSWAAIPLTGLGVTPRAFALDHADAEGGPGSQETTEKVRCQRPDIVRPATSPLSGIRSRYRWVKHCRRLLRPCAWQSRVTSVSLHGADESRPPYSLLRNSLFIMLTTVVNSGLGFVFWVLAARLFTAEVVGLIAAIIAAGTIVVLLASLGAGGTLIQSLPERESLRAGRAPSGPGMAIAVATSLAIGLRGARAAAALLLGSWPCSTGVAYATVFVVGTVALTARHDPRLRLYCRASGRRHARPQLGRGCRQGLLHRPVDPAGRHQRAEPPWRMGRGFRARSRSRRRSPDPEGEHPGLPRASALGRTAHDSAPVSRATNS